MDFCGISEYVHYLFMKTQTGLYLMIVNHCACSEADPEPAVEKKRVICSII